VGEKVCISIGIDMRVQEKISKAKARLMMDHPYFGTIASSLQIESDSEIESFSSDGSRFRYSSDYFDKAIVEDIEFALANGAMHSILKHMPRSGARNSRLWQLSTDYTPPRVDYQERFDDMYAEEIYEILKSEIDDDNITADDSEQDSSDDRSDDEPQVDRASESEKMRDISIDEQFLEQLHQKMDRQGTLPKDLKFVIPKLSSHRVDWREELYRYIATHAKSSFSFMPPNKKYLYRGIYLPSLSSDLLRIVVAIDSSGSIDEELLAIFLAEVDSITQHYPNYEIDIITADTKIQSHQVFLPSETLHYEVSGRGGTDFKVVFEYIERYIDYPTLLLYFTDGMGSFPDREPPYDTIWVMPSSNIDVPFGDIISFE